MKRVLCGLLFIGLISATPAAQAAMPSFLLGAGYEKITPSEGDTEDSTGFSGGVVAQWQLTTLEGLGVDLVGGVGGEYLNVSYDQDTAAGSVSANTSATLLRLQFGAERLLTPGWTLQGTVGYEHMLFGDAEVEVAGQTTTSDLDRMRRIRLSLLGAYAVAPNVGLGVEGHYIPMGIISLKDADDEDITGLGVRLVVSVGFP